MSFIDIVEFGGAKVSPEQMMRTHHRYYWAESYSRNKDVLEVGCGSGIGLPFLHKIVRRLEAGDYSAEVFEACKERHGKLVSLKQFSAESLPYDDASLDVVLIFEAIYYVPDVTKFIAECKRVLRQGGVVLVATANNMLWDFTPSPFSTKYLNITDFRDLFGNAGFDVSCFGYISTKNISFRQKVLRPLKALATKLGLIPRSMKGKEWLKKIFFGSLVTMPASIEADAIPYLPPIELNLDWDDVEYKTLYCAAKLQSQTNQL